MLNIIQFSIRILPVRLVHFKPSGLLKDIKIKLCLFLTLKAYIREKKLKWAIFLMLLKYFWASRPCCASHVIVHRIDNSV